jgi:hypothetical protein
MTKQPLRDTAPIPTGEEKTNPKILKQQLHYKKKNIMEVEDLHPDNQKNGVQTARNLLTTQPSVGVTKKKIVNPVENDIQQHEQQQETDPDFEYAVHSLFK